MPVDTKHDEYLDSLPKWTRCRDAVSGTDAVKGAGKVYLPPLSGQSPEEYRAYVDRAMWYGATERTVDGLMGAVFRRGAVIDVPEVMQEDIKDITKSGIPLESFSKKLMVEVLTTGRYGVLIDAPEMLEANQGPHWCGYPAESIINWRTEPINGFQILTLVVLTECVNKSEDGFKVDKIEQIRVLQLDGGIYRQSIWQFEEETKKWKLIQLMVPTIRGVYLNYIPFLFFSPKSLTSCQENPPILSLVDINFSHYRSSADLEHGRHFCGLPTPWVAGFPATTTLKVGSSTAWVTDRTDARAGMLEFTGQGLGALERALEDKEALMAVLGARLLEEKSRNVEAPDSLRIRYYGEQSVLRSITLTVSSGIKKLLEWHLQWRKAVGTVTFSLNTDFVDTRLSSADLIALVSAWQSGAISYETMFYNMKQGELTPPGVEAETEKQLIQEQRMLLLPEIQPKGGGKSEEEK
jgi:hypothetical protein